MKINKKLPDDLAKELGREEINPHVVEYVDVMIEKGKPLSFIDDYLLNCNLVTQDERELITEEIYAEISKPLMEERQKFLYDVMKEIPSVPLRQVLSIIKSIESSLEMTCYNDGDTVEMERRDDLYDIVQDVVFMHAPEEEDGGADLDAVNEWTHELYEYFLKHKKFMFEEEVEQQRRDEKNGLYPDKEDIAN